MLTLEDHRIYKLLTAKQWEMLCASGYFDGSEHDQCDGYIHLSRGSQVAATLERHYAASGDVVLVEVDGEPLGAALVYEPSRGGALFPHLYAPLPLSACKAIARRERADSDWQSL